MTERSDAVLAELEQIRAETGTLNPHDVVAFAENPATALHKEFEWDDGVAAQQYRLWQARQVIRVRIIALGDDGSKTRGYVSLREDRGGAGYRSIQEVLSDDRLRAALLEEAMREARSWRKRYERLRELAGVFAALDQLEEKIAV